MTDDFYKKAFETAVTDLRDSIAERFRLLEQIEVLERRIGKLRNSALSLASLTDIRYSQIKEEYPELVEEVTDPARVGITNAVRETLRRAGKWITMPEVKSGVFDIAPTVAAHKNPAASIHAVLRRLIDNLEVIEGADPEGRSIYAWVGTNEAMDNLIKVSPIGNKERLLEILHEVKKRRQKE